MLLFVRITTMHKRLQNRGFTIVELLIVIVVIAVLAAISIVAYNGISARANAAATMSTVKSLEKTLYIWAGNESFSVWPDEDSALILGSAPFNGGNPTFLYIYGGNPTFKSVISNPPTTSHLNDDALSYDSDDSDPNPKGSCSNGNYGTNIVITGIDTAEADIIEDSDEGDYDCGKWRYVPASKRFYYTISTTNAIN